MEDNSERERRVRASFNKQALMGLLDARLESVEAGAVDITLPFRPDLTQQSGTLHAGIVTSILDSACGYAALTTMPPDSEVLSVEFKVNLLRPARGDRFVAKGRVVKSGRTLTVVRGDAWGESNTERELVATMLATMIRVSAKDS